jgi:hypothetical protein
MVIREKLSDIQDLLIERAISKSTIKYYEIYKIFEENNGEKNEITKDDIWDTFEKACRNIAETEEAIYGALMSNKDGIPADGFFDIYSHKRAEKYNEIVGDKIIQNLTLEEMIQITNDERNTVYQHSQYI